MVTNQFLIRQSVDLSLKERYYAGYAGGQTYTGRSSLLNLSVRNSYVFICYNSDVSETVAGLTPAWVSGTNYTPARTVNYLGSYYRRTNTTTGYVTTTPPSAGTWWNLVTISEIGSLRYNAITNILVYMGDTFSVDSTEYDKEVTIGGIQRVTYIEPRAITVSPNPDEQKISLFKNVLVASYYKNVMFRYESLPNLTIINYPKTVGLSGGPTQATAIQCWLDLSECKNIRIIDIVADGGGYNFNINVFKLPVTATLKKFNIDSVNYSSNIFGIQPADSNLDFSSQSEIVEMSYGSCTLGTATPIPALSGFTPPTVSKLKIYECNKSTFTSLDLSASAFLTYFKFSYNNNITSINLTNCVLLNFIYLNVNSNSINSGTMNSLVSFTLPSTLNNLTTFYLNSCSSLGGALDLPSMTSCATVYLYTLAYSSVTFNSDIGANADSRVYNCSSLININSFPSNAKQVYLDTCGSLTNSNSLFDTIVSADRAKLILIALPSFSKTNPDLSALVSCTEFRTDGIAISGAFVLPSTNVMTRLAFSNATSVNRLPTSLVSLYINASASLADANFAASQSPKIPATCSLVYINTTALNTSINDLSHLTPSNLNIYLQNNTSLTSLTLPATSKGFSTNLQSRPLGSQLGGNTNLVAGLNISGCTSLSILSNLVGVNHSFTSSSIFNVSNTSLNMEFPFGKSGNTNFLPGNISLNSMSSMTLENLYLSLKNIYDNKALWSDYNSENGSMLNKPLNLNNTIITTKTLLAPTGFVSRSSDGTITTGVDVATYIQAIREMGYVLVNQLPVSGSAKKYRWSITL